MRVREGRVQIQTIPEESSRVEGPDESPSPLSPRSIIKVQMKNPFLSILPGVSVFVTSLSYRLPPTHPSLLWDLVKTGVLGEYTGRLVLY